MGTPHRQSSLQVLIGVAISPQIENRKKAYIGPKGLTNRLPYLKNELSQKNVAFDVEDRLNCETTFTSSRELGKGNKEQTLKKL